LLLNIFIVKKLSGENEEESETQENDGLRLSIQNRDDEDPDTITHVPRLSFKGSQVATFEPWC
jgi:hypothetical protein